MKNVLNSYLHQSLTNFFHPLTALLGWGSPAKQQFTRKVIKGKLFAHFRGEGVKMCDKMAISAYALKIVEKDPFLGFKEELRKCLIITNFFLQIGNT